MGITNSQKDPNEKKNQQGQTSINSTLLIELAVMIRDDILRQFQKQKIDVKQFKKQMFEPNDTDSLRKTNNFIGRINSEGKIYGICKFFQRKNNVCNIYIGYTQDGVIQGKGIKIISYLTPRSENSQQITVDKTKYEAYLMNQWKTKTNQIQNGSLIKKNNNNYDIFTGEFLSRQTESYYHKGTLTLKEGELTKLKYKGQFQSSQIYGKGELQIPGVYKYIGQFHNQFKDGLGEEWDQIRKTYYVGEFEAGSRSGYGELVYLNREGLRLKGFWEKGQILAKEGVYVDRNGEYLETIGDDIHLL